MRLTVSLHCREQILGEEARAKVPSEFVVQNNHNANPPTLFLPLQLIVKQLISSDKPEDRTYLKHLYPRLEAWYNWFNTSQVMYVKNLYPRLEAWYNSFNITQVKLPVIFQTVESASCQSRFFRFEFPAKLGRLPNNHWCNHL